MTQPLRPALLRTLIRLAALLQSGEVVPAGRALYDGLSLSEKQTHDNLRDLRALGLVDRTRAHGHIWITEKGLVLLDARAAGQPLASPQQNS